jgi:UDP-N-acetyl-D-galactosamine dehydrogenase
MGVFVANKFIRKMLEERIHVNGSRILIMGLTFKENCPDLRNTRVIDIIRELEDYGMKIDVHDPWVSAQDAETACGFPTVQNLEAGVYDGIVMAVNHDQYKAMDEAAFRKLGKNNHVLFDLKYILPKEGSDIRL